MKKKDILHPIQLEVLRSLMFSEGLRYTEIKPEKSLENNHFQYYLDKLLVSKIVEKVGNLYCLTGKGKTLVSSIEYETLNTVSQPKSHVLLCARRLVDGEFEYLLYTRTKHPYYGSQGFPTGKVKKGNTGPEEAKREFIEETGLVGEPKLSAIFRNILVDPENKEKVVDDLILFAYIIDDPKGTLIQTVEGRYEWVKESELENFIQKPFISKEQFFYELKKIEEANGKDVSFYENEFEKADSF